MNTPEEVDASCILPKAMSVVRSARKEILVTMDLAEEIERPLPSGYFLLLQKKLTEGVTVKRLAFGGSSDFEIFTHRYNIIHENYSCILAKTKNYKRMLLVDQSQLLFALNRGGKRRFYYTEDTQYIKKFIKYFQKEFLIAVQ